MSQPQFILDMGGPQAAGPVLGMEHGYVWRNYMNRAGALVRGDVVQVDIGGFATETVTTDNTATGNFAAVIVPRTGFVLGREPGICAVALEAVADNAAGRFAIFGQVQAMIIGAGGTGAIHDDLVVTTAKNLDVVAATGERVFGFLAEAATTITARELHLVFLDNGFVYFNGIQAQTAG